MVDMTNGYDTHKDLIEANRQGGGLFGELPKTAPADGTLQVAAWTKPLTVTTTVELTHGDPLPYPEDIPEGGALSAGIDDASGSVYMSIDFPDGTHVSRGVDGDGDPWDNLDDIDTGYPDEVNEEIVRYLDTVRERVSGPADELMYKALSDDNLNAILATVTGPAIPEPDDTPETWNARNVERGATLASVYSGKDDDDESNVTDAIADILIFAQSKGIDLDEVLAKAMGHVEDAKAELDDFRSGAWG